MTRLELKGARTCVIFEFSRMSLVCPDRKSRPATGTSSCQHGPGLSGLRKAREHIAESVARVSFLKSLVGVLMR